MILDNHFDLTIYIYLLFDNVDNKRNRNLILIGGCSRAGKSYIANYINNVGGDVNYIEICCAETLEELDVIDKEAIIVVAARFGWVDIWDNIIIEPK